MRYLISFLQKHEDFRLAELNALLKMNGLAPSEVYEQSDYSQVSPYLVVNFPSEVVAAAVCDRGILIKAVMELWGDGPSYEAASAAAEQLDGAFVEPYYRADSSWAIFVDAFGLSLDLAQQAEARSHFRRLGFQGPVKCKDGDNVFFCLEHHAAGPTGLVPAGSKPSWVYFGREVCRSSRYDTAPGACAAWALLLKAMHCTLC